jgi:S-adenosylmethionine:diacylglycerol 3-amino-3-carboxypropyl transferase
MLQANEPVQTSWLQGAFRAKAGRLVFGQTYEDARIEMKAIPPRCRVFCIAGAGVTAQVLAAAGHCVTAVDINMAQVEYARARSVGEPARDGIAERVLEFGRHLTTACGWTRQKLDAFLNLSSCREQTEFWDRELDTPLWRVMVDTLLAPRLLRLCYRGPFVASLPRDFGPRVRERLRRGWASHRNCSNPFAALLLQARPLPLTKSFEMPIRFVCADAAEFLEHCPPGSFDAFALSNISDGVSTQYRSRLNAAVEHAAAPGAVVITRSFAEPARGDDVNWAARDRSHLWGVVRVCRLGVPGYGGESCCIG